MRKNLLVAFTAVLGFSAQLQAQFTTKWEKSAAVSADVAAPGYRWFFTTGDRASSMAFNKATGNLLVTVRGTAVGGTASLPVNPTIIVLNANTGDSITSLSVAGIPAISAGLAHNFQKVRVDDNGVIYAISLSLGSASNTPAGSAVLRVLRWANEAATPTECARFNVTERVGDAFGLSGTGVNTVLYCAGNSPAWGGTSSTFPGSGRNNIYALRTSDGTSFTSIDTIAITAAVNGGTPLPAHWARGALEPIGTGVTSDLWVKASSQPARRLTITGTAPLYNVTVAYTSNDGTGNGQFANTFSQMGYLAVSDGRRYLAGASGAATANTHLFKMINITSQVSPADVGTDNLTNSPVNANINASGDVAFKANGNGTYDIFYLSTNNGLKALTSTVLLPVQFASFTASVANGTSQLQWITSNELNNKQFVIQSSLNGTQFANIATVQSKAINGTSSANNTYQFTDARKLRGKVFYRLQQVDKDGSISYSATVSVVFSNKATAVQIVNNPVQQTLQAIVTTIESKKIQWQLFSVEGKLMASNNVQLQVGDNSLQISMASYKAGTYYLQVTDDKGQAIEKAMPVVKQ